MESRGWRLEESPGLSKRAIRTTNKQSILNVTVALKVKGNNGRARKLCIPGHCAQSADEILWIRIVSSVSATDSALTSMLLEQINLGFE